jgi:hypothetical protein
MGDTHLSHSVTCLLYDTTVCTLIGRSSVWTGDGLHSSWLLGVLLTVTDLGQGTIRSDQIRSDELSSM